MLAADERGEPGCARLEAALDRPLAEHAPRPDRLGKTFEALRAELLNRESKADKLPGQPVDHDLVRLSQGFQPRRKVRGFTGDGAGLAAPGGVEVADHDRTGSDPRMRLQRQFADRSDRIEPGTHRLRRLVLVGARPAEIGDDAVAEEIGYIAAVPHHGPAHRILVAADQLAQILRIEAARQFGRAHQIAEQDRQLAPLCVAAWRLRRGIDDSLARPLGKGALQPSSMAERQPQFFQILVAELGQDIEIDVVGGESLGMLRQSDLLEPKAQLV